MLILLWTHCVYHVTELCLPGVYKRKKILRYIRWKWSRIVDSLTPRRRLWHWEDEPTDEVFSRVKFLNSVANRSAQIVKNTSCQSLHSSSPLGLYPSHNRCCADLPCRVFIMTTAQSSGCFNWRRPSPDSAAWGPASLGADWLTPTDDWQLYTRTRRLRHRILWAHLPV